MAEADPACKSPALYRRVPTEKTKGRRSGEFRVTEMWNFLRMSRYKPQLGCYAIISCNSLLNTKTSASR